MRVSSGVRACLGLRHPRTARSSHSSRLKTAGFTLIELVCVLGIIGVLASIAIPHFTNFLIRARRSEAYLGLKGVHVAQTAFFTEVGRYGASFDGLAALLGMLNSCASGVVVVNIDNGFGAGRFAAMVNR